MAKVFITGVGLEQAGLSLDNLSDRLAAPATDRSSPNSKPQAALTSELASALAREDRAVLSDAAILSLVVSQTAVRIAQQNGQFSDADRSLTAVYTTAETVRDFYEILWEYRARHPAMTKRELYAHLGDLARTVHPLRLFRKLPTNNLYHIAKLFGLTGGGYPLRKMSLGGLSLLEEAHFSLSYEACGGALVCALGDMTKSDNFEAFRKMGLVSTTQQQLRGNVSVCKGAVSLMMESAGMQKGSRHRILAEVISVHSRFDIQMFSGRAEWNCLYRQLAKVMSDESPLVILYDNGAPGIGNEEERAIRDYFPHAELRRYKPHTGYAASTSGLVDLVCALADERIEVGRTFVVNGTGAGMGCACAVVKKHQQLTGPLTRFAS